MRWIEPGEFLMGSPSGEPERREDEYRHRVVLTKGFWLTDTACTQPLWQAVMKTNPSHFKGNNLPVENKSWEMALEFIKKCNLLIPGLHYACLQKQNGNTSAAQVQPRHFFLEKRSIRTRQIIMGIFLIMKVKKENTGKKPWELSPCPVINGDCIRCTEMCGNGVQTGMVRNTTRTAQ